MWPEGKTELYSTLDPAQVGLTAIVLIKTPLVRDRKHGK